MECNLSDRSVSRIVKDLKEKYSDYKQIEISKLKVLTE